MCRDLEDGPGAAGPSHSASVHPIKYSHMTVHVLSFVIKSPPLLAFSCLLPLTHLPLHWENRARELNKLFHLHPPIYLHLSHLLVSLSLLWWTTLCLGGHTPSTHLNSFPFYSWTEIHKLSPLFSVSIFPSLTGLIYPQYKWTSHAYTNNFPNLKKNPLWIFH